MTHAGGEGVGGGGKHNACSLLEDCFFAKVLVDCG